MKIIFAGTPAFAESALQALIDSHHEILAVYTQPDRPSGRGLKLTPSPVKTLALQHGLTVCQPASLKGEDEQRALAAFGADVMVVAAYGLLLPAAVLTIPAKGCINIHPSLLPRWRGAAPIQRTLHAGDKETGVTIMEMDVGLDTGPMLLRKLYTIADDETSKTLHDKLAVIGASALIETLALVEQGKSKPEVQDNELATYASKLSKEEALLDWTKPAATLVNEIKAFNPWPVAHTNWKNEHLRIWLAKVVDVESKQEPRTIVNASREGIDIATGEGVVRLLQVQMPGGKAQSISDFYNAHRNELKVGDHFI